MNLEPIVISMIIMLILTMMLSIYREIKINKRLKSLEDFNIEFKGMNGSVSKERKKYQRHEITDDFRHKVKKGHSISKGMNDPSLQQKKAFNKEI